MKNFYPSTPRNHGIKSIPSVHRKSRGSIHILSTSRNAIVGIMAGLALSSCGDSSREEPIVRQEVTNRGDPLPSVARERALTQTVPLSSVPTSAVIETEGMLGYGTLYFEDPISGYISGGTIDPMRAVNTYNPREILTKLGVTEWIIVRCNFQYQLDRNNDGLIDKNWTQIHGPMQMIVHRSVFERGEKIYFNPRASLISETLLWKQGKVISQKALDTMARASGADDWNSDGKIDYTDIASTKIGSIHTLSQTIPGLIGYTASMYTPDGDIKRLASLKTLAKMENHLMLSIIPNSNNHDPVLQIEASAASNILYTLDGSSPIPGSPTTFSKYGSVTIPLQDRKIYYREQLTMNNEVILGAVKSFDLATDWTQLSQELQTHNPVGKETLEETIHRYNGMTYTLRVNSNKLNSGFTYPKFIDCQVGENQNDGCDLGPYIIYNESHESKVRSLIHLAAQAHINSLIGVPPPPTTLSGVPSTNTVNTVPSHYQNEITSYSGKIDYLGGWYEVFNQWNSGGKADYPVTIIGAFALPNAPRQPNITAIAHNDTDRITFSKSMIGRIRSQIEGVYYNLPKPTYPTNYIVPSTTIGYRGYTYSIIRTMNTSGYSDYPASIYATYTTPAGNRNTIATMAKDATEVVQQELYHASEAKAQIDIALGTDNFAPSQEVIISPRRSYGTGSYETRFTYSGNTGQDYPGYIDIYYTLSNGTKDKYTVQVSNENQKKTLILNGESEVKLRIDNIPLHPIDAVTNSGQIPYGTKGAHYTIYAKYNRVGTGYNYPALVWIEYRPSATSPLLDTRNTYGVIEAKNSEHKEQLKSTLEGWVRGQMIAMGPTDNTQQVAMTKKSIIDILISSAHAQYIPPIVSKNDKTRATSLAPYSSDISFFQAYNQGMTTKDFFLKSGANTPAGKSKADAVGKTEEEAREKFQISDSEKRYKEVQVELIKRLKNIQDVNRGLATCTGYGLTINTCIPLSPYDLFPSPSSKSQPTATMALKIGEQLFGRYATGEFSKVLEEILLKYPDKFLIMYAIIIEEQSHLAPPIFEDRLSSGSLGLSQITRIPTANDRKYFGYTDYQSVDLLDPIKHLKVMNNRLDRINYVLGNEGIASTPENIGRIWNGGYNCRVPGDLCPNSAINYGKRVRDYNDNLLKYYKLYIGN